MPDQHTPPISLEAYFHRKIEEAENAKINRLHEGIATFESRLGADLMAALRGSNLTQWSISEFDLCASCDFSWSGAKWMLALDFSEESIENGKVTIDSGKGSSRTIPMMQLSEDSFATLLQVIKGEYLAKK